MKRKQWLAGILAAGLLCALPLFGAFAAPRARTRAAAPTAAGAAITLTAQGNYTYGDAIKVTAQITGLDAGVSLPSGTVTLYYNSTQLDQQNVTSPTNGVILSYDTKGKAIPAGQNITLTARFTNSDTSPGALVVAEGNLELTLAKKQLTAKIPDLTYNGGTTFQNVELVLSNKIDKDEVKATVNVTVEDKNADNSKSVKTIESLPDPAAKAGGATPTTDDLALTGKDAAYYTLPKAEVATTAKILKKAIRFDAQAADKIYNGKTETSATLTFQDTISGETLKLGEDYTVNAQFTDADAGEDKDVNVTATLVKTGIIARNYTLSSNMATKKAAIKPAVLTVESATVAPKTYDNTAVATVTGEIVFQGLVGSDALVRDTHYTIAAAAFGNAHAGKDKQVKLTLEATGDMPANYTLPTEGTVTGTINPKPLTIASATVEKKTYDGTTTTSVKALSFEGLVGGIQFEAGTDYTATANFADANAGENKNVTVEVTLKDSEKAKNYTLASNEFFPTGTIEQAKIPLSITLQRKSESGKAPVLQMKVTAGPRPSTSAAWPTGSVDIKVQAGSDTRQGAGVFTDGALTLELPDIAGASLATATASYVGDANYEPAAGSGPFNLAPAPTPAPTPKPAPTPAPTPKPFDWYPGLGSIQSVKSGKVTIDAGSEIAVPHFIWQAIYGKDITLTITRGADKYVFNGLDLKASGFDPDNGHNLTDLKAYIGRSYDKPKATATPAPTASPKPTASPSPAPTASPAPTTAPQATPAPSAQPAQGGAASGWLYWVIGGAALLIVVLGAVLLFLRRKNAEQDPYGYND